MVKAGRAMVKAGSADRVRRWPCYVVGSMAMLQIGRQ
jgi:hypothetical protein